MDRWATLKSCAKRAAGRSIVELFADTSRAESYRATLDDPILGQVLFDYSKTGIDAEARQVLLALAAESGVPEMSPNKTVEQSKAWLGLGRIVALHRRSSTSYQIC